MASLIATACAKSEAKVELVGTIGDDAAGDAVTVDLARAGVGHAALLRLPGVATSTAGEVPGALTGSGPRLDAGDLDLGLRYLHDVRVIVVAELLPEELESIIVEAAAYAGAVIVAVAGPGTSVGAVMAEAATVLEAPVAALTPFAEMIGRYAAGLDAGASPADAFAAATQGAGWEPAG
ncbi:MAG: hypothetical protein ACRDF7_00915 [Candidatus Limnocylindrales bacterium]